MPVALRCSLGAVRARHASCTSKHAVTYSSKPRLPPRHASIERQRGSGNSVVTRSVVGDGGHDGRGHEHGKEVVEVVERTIRYPDIEPVNDVPEAEATTVAAPAFSAASHTHSHQTYQAAPTSTEPSAADRITASKAGRFALWGVAAVLGTSLIVAVFRIVRKYSDPRAQKKRRVNKNAALVTELAQYLPDKRAELNKSTIAVLKLKTGFDSVEVFRKYLWYMLRERKFDEEAIKDVVHLRQVLELSDMQVAEAFKERAIRIERKFGRVMLDTSGLTSEGVQRKATARAFFSKMLYLVECGQFFPADSEAAAAADLLEVFGVKEEEAAKLRIVSLYDIDLEKLIGMDPQSPLLDDREDNM